MESIVDKRLDKKTVLSIIAAIHEYASAGRAHREITSPVKGSSAIPYSGVILYL